ncbi:phospholipase, partial [Streptomyces sp. NPDC058964]
MLISSALPTVPAFAESPTPHLDSVEQTLREVSPGLEGRAWERTSGNALDTGGGAPSDWLLPTPACWGDPACTERGGTQRLLTRMEENISTATRTVDISSLAPFPDGAFQDAIVAGLKKAAAAGHKLKVRVLVGAAPIYHLNVVPSKYRDALRTALGDAAQNVTRGLAPVTARDN